MKQELNPNIRCDIALDVEKELLDKVAGQDEAIKKVVQTFQIYFAGLTPLDRPQAVFLLLGPTGTGKTHLVESTAEVISRKANSVLKIDCAEFQQSHEIAKLIGSPPGYIGHNTTTPIFCQENIDAQPFILLDEVEKAHASLLRLMLGVLDKGKARLGTNEIVDFTKTFIFMTSNLGAKEMGERLIPKIGYSIDLENPEKDTKANITKIGMNAVTKAFPPEFVNRLDDVIVFDSLKRDDLFKILDRELVKVQNRITFSSNKRKCVFIVDQDAKKFLIDTGYSPQYGARHLKRAIEKHIVFPLSAIIATQQVATGDIVHIGHKPGEDHPTFVKEPKGALVRSQENNVSSKALMALEA